MASTSQVLVLRLRSGGVLVVAPATSLPWPRVLGRKLQRLQEYGVQVAMADPHAMARLRDELPRMLNQPITRGAMPDRDALASALLTGVRQGELTLLYGHAETGLREGRAGDLSKRFGSVALSRRDGSDKSSAKPEKGLPPPTKPLPRERTERLHWTCTRALTHLTTPLDKDMLEFFSEVDSPLTAQLLTLWSETMEAGAGFTVDAGMFATAAWRLGAEAPRAFDELAEAFTLVVAATDWPTLDRAAGKLASGSGLLRPGLFRQFLRRLGDRLGSGGQSVGGEAGASSAGGRDGVLTA